jgi:hypothetical protein
VQQAANNRSEVDWDAPSSTPWMSQGAKTESAFWRLYYAVCNAICTSLPSTVYSTARLIAVFLLLIQCAFMSGLPI